MIKPPQTELQYTWLIAVWSPVFTQFMHEYVLGSKRAYTNQASPKQTEVYVGHVIQKAIELGLNIEAVPFQNGHYLDIGTPEDLMRASIRQIEWLKQDSSKFGDL